MCITFSTFFTEEALNKFIKHYTNAIRLFNSGSKEPQTCPPEREADTEEIEATDIQRPPRAWEPQQNYNQDYPIGGAYGGAGGPYETQVSMAHHPPAEAGQRQGAQAQAPPSNHRECPGHPATDSKNH
ncbi:hypothetical protein AMECASPLE_023652 [Ameca splendens]|uniref:Uncharacterized protein n=1 Tax=Ameca splendens TaxID=208324 RepID=A0ABV0XH55_9TELE